MPSSPPTVTDTSCRGTGCAGESSGTRPRTCCGRRSRGWCRDPAGGGRGRAGRRAGARGELHGVRERRARVPDRSVARQLGDAAGIVPHGDHPRHHRAPAARGAAPAGPEDGGGRAAGRRASPTTSTTCSPSSAGYAELLLRPARSRTTRCADGVERDPARPPSARPTLTRQLLAFSRKQVLAAAGPRPERDRLRDASRCCGG